MRTLVSLHSRIFAALEARIAPILMPTLARVVFAATLLVYFWTSAMTKIGEGVAGLFQPSFNAYVQILPRMSEAVGYDASQLGAVWRLVVVAGTWAEVLLPMLIVLGLFTRLASLGMIGFVLVQSYVDIVGHGVGSDVIGAWFDAGSDSLILDQRAFWVFLLAYLVMHGAGPVSVDAALRSRAMPQTSAA